MSDRTVFQSLDFMTRRFPLNRLLNTLRNNSASHLIEINGGTGSGKTYLVKPLLEALGKSYKRVNYYSPHPLFFNQFNRVLRLLCDVKTPNWTPC